MYQFTPASAHPWKSGDLFLGADEHGHAVGISTERHAITIAGSQSGKGVGVIIPNLLRWPHNALTIDPKGEAAAATVEAREAMGLPSFVFAPFAKTIKVNVPDHLLVTINPLENLDPESFTITEDIGAISDGLVMRPDAQAAHWDDGAASILSGLIAYVILHYQQAEKNLLTVRKIQRNSDLFAETIEAMKTEERCGGLCQTGASAAFAKEGGYFVSNAEKNTRWLDSQAMQNALASSSFDMESLKWGKASLFLVLPSKYLNQHGRFLRLFVRMALEAMMTSNDSGEIKGSPCLFILDEFFSLGYIDEISKSAGLMAGYGLKLWPILQDLEQLNKLYGNDGAATFFGSADLHQFFGNMDTPTLRFVSEKIGNYAPADLAREPRVNLEKVKYIRAEIDKEKGRFFGGSPHAILGMTAAAKIEIQYAQDVYNEDIAKFNNEASRVLGKPRVTPDQVATLIKKPERGPAKHMIAFIHGGEPILVNLAPYYLDKSASALPRKTKEPSKNTPIEQTKTAPPKPKQGSTQKELETYAGQNVIRCTSCGMLDQPFAIITQKMTSHCACPKCGNIAFFLQWDTKQNSYKGVSR